jgi:hypothetical protein
MAKEKWTVLYGIRDGGNQKPVTGWKEKEFKVQKLSSATALEKNEPWQQEAPGKFASAEIQQCYFVTVVAESAEEACLVVERFLNQGFSSKAQGEEQGGGGPSIKAFTNSNGKAMAALTSNVTEVAVL